MRVLLPICLLLLATPAPASAQTSAPARALAVGDLAPDFWLAGSDGKTYRLADYRGKQVVVLVWFARAFSGG